MQFHLGCVRPDIVSPTNEWFRDLVSRYLSPSLTFPNPLVATDYDCYVWKPKRCRDSSDPFWHYSGRCTHWKPSSRGYGVGRFVYRGRGHSIDLCVVKHILNKEVIRYDSTWSIVCILYQHNWPKIQNYFKIYCATFNTVTERKEWDLKGRNRTVCRLSLFRSISDWYSGNCSVMLSTLWFENAHIIFCCLLGLNTTLH